MRTLARTATMATACLVIVGDCSLAGHEPMLSKGDWTEARQQQVDLVTTVAHETSTDAYVVVESIGPCDSVDDLDETIASSDYLVTARITPDTQQTLDDVIRPRMDADGWTFRDRSGEPPKLDETILEYLWTKSGARLNVTVSADPENGPIIQVSASSPCGKRGDVLSGRTRRDDPWYLAPTVEGPTIDDNRPTN